MYKNLSLKAKLLSICSLLSTFTVIVGAISFFALREVGINYEHVAKINLGNALALGDMSSTFLHVRLAIGSLGMKGLSDEASAEAVKRIQSAIETYEKADAQYNTVPFVDGEEAIYKPVNEAWAAYKVSGLKIVSHFQAHTAQDQKDMLALMYGIAATDAARFDASLAKLITFQNDQAKTWSEKAVQVSKWSSALVTLLVIFGFSLAMTIAYFFSRSLNLTLSTLGERLRVGSEEVASASRLISDAGSELSASATEQAAALQQTVSSIDQVSAMVSKNADNARKSQEVSSGSHDTANRGKRVVEEMVHAIDEITRSNTDIMNQIELSNQEISDIVKVIAEIGNKTKVINDIVFQTKLLSFNASVEAARAGEHGKGFAVVAEEVGNLAQMSGNAAKEISQMLDGSIQKVEKIVTDTKSKVQGLVTTGKEKVATGTSTARRCGEVLDEIVNSVAQVREMASEISTACQEQAQGVQEITKAMGQLDQVTQQNASASQQSAGAAEQLTGQAGELRGMVKELVSTVQGGGRSETSGRAPETRSDPAKVVPMRKKRPVQEQPVREVLHSTRMKKAVGAEHIPSNDDPRFDDV